MVNSKKSVILAVKEDDIKGSELKLSVARKYMENRKIFMKKENSEEYENLFSALNINIEKF